MKEYKEQKIKEVIKAQLKKYKYTYDDLGEHLECSVPTIKRILGAEELTLNRLLSICEFLDLELNELELLANQTEKNMEEFTADQQAFLAKNPKHLAFLVQLFSGKSVKQITEEFSLNKKSLDRFLIDLEKYELIRVTGKMRVKTAYKEMPNWVVGPLSKLYVEEILNSGNSFFKKRFKEILHSEKDRKSMQIEHLPNQFTLSTISVSKEIYREWMKEHKKHIDELMRISKLEKKAKDPKELMTAVIMNANVLVDSNYGGLDKISDSFGGKLANL